MVWDGLPQHRARLVTEFIHAPRGRLAVERLPAYAPGLNPVEYIWGYWKHHELPNFCPRDFGQLSYQARRALRRMRRRPRLGARSGSEQICHYDMQVSISREWRGGAGGSADAR